MHCTRKLTNSVSWVGGDRRKSLSHSRGENVILDEQTALVDTADSSITRQFFENIEAVAGGRWIISSSTIWSRTIAPILTSCSCAIPT